MEKILLIAVCLIASAAFAESNLPQGQGGNESPEQMRQRIEEMQRPGREMPQVSPNETISIPYKQQLAQEYQKHNYRVAVLERIRELAREAGRADIISKVDELMKLENNRHVKKINKLQFRAK
ncbi:MAG: hypothetical protein A2Y10_11090 [Planctomycetes bacterium GWF2_41_51]|nr:MAG: hypothetical protein A2Y10_11090 [Planctomycetes bacterium GWF2_41_51]HBG28406.1 hypothetical protein [Phycisphaerales bacterium]